MQTRHRNTFTTIHSEGALLPPDLLARISEGDSSLEGLKPSDYHLLKNEKLNEAINRSWNRLIGAWKNFKEARHKLLVGQPGTTETRERWLLPLFQELGYGRLQTSAAFEIEGKSYPISHLWGSAPIHLLGCNIELDKRTPGIAGAARRSPHSMLQEFLNRSEDHLWAILSNGLRLRLLRDNVSLTRQSFLEFDLEAMMEGEVYSDFVLLWMICHQSRFEQKMASGELRMASGEKPLATRHSPLTDNWLEKWTHAAHEQGTRALDQLREGVEESINQLGSGFLGHPSNQAMRAKLRSGSLSTQDYYRQLLRLVYRLIFLFVAEDRDLLFPPNSDEIAQQRYTEYYSTRRLRHLAERSRGSRHADLWQGLLVVINLLNGKGMVSGEQGMANGEWGVANGAPLANSHLLLALPVLGSFLFSEQSAPDLDSAQLANTNLLTAIRALAYTVDQRTLRPVDYKNLGPEELGSVYESLLELHPEINIDAGTFNLTTAGGHERKTTGSYYTPSSLIQALLDSALDPVVEDRLEMAKRMGNGEWRVGNGEWELDEWKWKDEGEKAYADSILSRFRDLAKKHGFIGGHLPSNTRHQLLAEAGLLSLNVCDPACGSGHFLIAAAHRIARRLAGVRTGEDEPAPDATRAALRDVISRCIYGVDLNPMAVELCKVGLWMEALEPGKPLSFLDAHIKCGNSLVGVGPGVANGDRRIDHSPSTTRRSLLTIPDNAFQPAFGDDKDTATALRRRNKRERQGQLGIRWDVTLIKDQDDLARWVAKKTEQVETMPEFDAQQIREKEEAYHSLLATRQYQQQRLEYDLWTAAFFWAIPKGDAENMLAPTQQELIRLRRGEELDVELLRLVQKIAKKQRFFHWEFEFPTVFGGAENGEWGVVSGELRMENEPLATRQSPLTNNHPPLTKSGFDIVVGNPPWERIKLQEQEFFAGLEPEIEQAPNKAAREKLIKKLPQDNPGLWRLFCQAKADAENTSNFVRNSRRFPLTAVGDVNTYALFAGLARHILGASGRAGIIVPTGIATDDTTKQYFSDVIESKCLVSLFDFENKEALFQGVHRSYKFCLLTLSGSQIAQAEFIFFAQNVNHLRDPLRRFSLYADEIKMFNPNTRTMPIFRTKPDAELTKYIYQRVPVLDNVSTGDNPWGVKFLRMIDMANDSHLFITEPRPGYVPLYEAKLMHQFDHRWATYENGEVREVTLAEKQDPNYEVQPRYWVPQKEVEERLKDWDKGWLLGFRDITNATNERTAIFSFLPRVGVGHTVPILLFNCNKIHFCGTLLSNLNSISFDYIARQKIGGIHLTFGFLKQLTILPINTYSKFGLLFITSRLIELVFTIWNSKSLAEDLGYASSALCWNESRRALLRAELDAYYAYLYGLNRKQLRYILDPADLTESELEDILDPWEEVADPLDVDGYAARAAASTFPGETFRVLKEKEIRKYGEYRTRRLVLEAWERLAAVDFDVEAYVPMLDPPPAHPSLAHPNKDGSVYEGSGLVLNMDEEEDGKMLAVKEEQADYQTIESTDINDEDETGLISESQDKSAEYTEHSTLMTDWDMYKCLACGQIVLGFGKDEHIRLIHKGKEISWQKIK